MCLINQVCSEISGETQRHNEKDGDSSQRQCSIRPWFLGRRCGSVVQEGGRAFGIGTPASRSGGP